MLIFGCLFLTIFSTIDKYCFPLLYKVLTCQFRFEQDATAILSYVEVVIMSQFLIEYILRLWSAGARGRYDGIRGRLRYASSFFPLLDLIVVVAGITLFIFGWADSRGLSASSALRSLRFLQLIRMVRLDKNGSSWKLLGSVIYAHRKELITALYLGFLTLIFAAFIIYQCEHGENKDFTTFADSLWWGLTSFTTIGYGDRYPESVPGKIMTSAFAVFGISFFALPAGILGTGFALKVQDQQRQKHMVKRRNPAATLIQIVWRIYAAENLKKEVIYESKLVFE